MTALCLTVLLASLAGSLHCAGMCGAFVAFAIGVGDPAVKQSRALLLSLYQIGRLLTYTTLGAVAGTLGSGIDLGGRIAGLQHAAAILAGAMMVGFGSITLARLAGWKVPASAVPKQWSNFVTSMHRRSLAYSPPARAIATGLLTTLIPCGWLYAFVITAAGTGHAWSGALLMATFWVGTLPALTFVGLGVRSLAGVFANRIPWISATAILVVGLYTITARAQLTIHHATHLSASDTAELAREVNAIDQHSLPCCTQPAVKGAVQ
jgi:sulfite exporter TauE/SafE